MLRTQYRIVQYSTSQLSMVVGSPYFLVRSEIKAKQVYTLSSILTHFITFALQTTLLLVPIPGDAVLFSCQNTEQCVRSSVQCRVVHDCNAVQYSTVQCMTAVQYIMKMELSDRQYDYFGDMEEGNRRHVFCLQTSTKLSRSTVRNTEHKKKRFKCQINFFT